MTVTNCVNDNRRKELLRKVQICDFAINEAVLYLDGHPTNQSALNYFHKYKKLREQAVMEYEMAYGPLTFTGEVDEKAWNWIAAPWPWETEA